MSVKHIETDTPSDSDIINQIPSISNPNKVSMLLFYSKAEVITSFLTKSEIITIKNNGVKIITFGVIDEYTTMPNKAIYENIYTVNGYFESLKDSNDILINEMNNDIYFISNLMLKYLDSSDSDINNDIVLNSESFISLKLSEFNMIYNNNNKYFISMSESNIIQRTMYFGKVNSDGKVEDIIDLYSNTYDNNPYTFISDTNYTICKDSELIIDDNIIRVGFLSSLSFENEYMFDIYHGLVFSFNNYQQIVYISIYLFYLLL